MILDIDNFFFVYAKELSEPKYEFIIKKRKEVGVKYCNDPNTFIECSNTVDDVYQNILMITAQTEKEIS